jgi:hypothetical protein
MHRTQLSKKEKRKPAAILCRCFDLFFVLATNTYWHPSAPPPGMIPQSPYNSGL